MDKLTEGQLFDHTPHQLSKVDAGVGGAYAVLYDSSLRIH
jgi:hypothetical protein